MAGFNKLERQPVRVAASGPMRTLGATPDTVNHAGAPAYLSDDQTALFKLATTRFVGEPAFYETANELADQLRELVTRLATSDETWPWVRVFLSWLRGPGNIRTASILLAAEAVHARLAAGKHGDGNRELIESVLQRADEPGEMIAYWRHRYGVILPDGRVQAHLPKPVKRGIADAVNRLYDEAAFLRHNKDTAAVHMADVLELTHAIGKYAANINLVSLGLATRSWQDDLFRWMITARRDRDAEPPETLTHVRARHALSRWSPDERHRCVRSALEGNQVSLDLIHGAMVGQWEWLKPWLGEKPTEIPPVTDAEIWQLALPKLGYMALLRNLRGLDQAGVPDTVVGPAITRLADPEQVRKSRQLPFRFWSAYAELQKLGSLRWLHALEQGLNHSLRNIPVLDGQTLVLVDVSDSMTWGHLSTNSDMDYATAAAIFALGLKIRNPSAVDVWGFANRQFVVKGVDAGTSLLRAVETFKRFQGSVGGGTETARAIRETIQPHHRRVILLTDNQTFGGSGYRFGDVDGAAPRNVPIFAVNVCGYRNSAMPVQPGNNRFELGGLTDAMFTLIPTLEAGEAGRWPWE